MIELTYAGEAVEVVGNADVPFNRVMKSGCAERYEGNTNTLTLVKPGRYLVTASANVALPDGGIVGSEIRLAITANGASITGAEMASTPQVTEAMNNVATQTYIDVYPCCCKTVSLRNIGVAADVDNQNLTAVRVNG